MALFQPPALFAWAHACVITVALFVCTNVDIVSCCLLWVWVFGKLTSVSFDFGFLLLRLFCNFNSTGVFLGVAKRKLVLDAPSASLFCSVRKYLGEFPAKCKMSLYFVEKSITDKMTKGCLKLTENLITWANTGSVIRFTQRQLCEQIVQWSL